jgi:hypothetical protein
MEILLRKDIHLTCDKTIANQALQDYFLSKDNYFLLEKF